MKSFTKKYCGLLLALLFGLASAPGSLWAHCDTMDGPTVADGRKALESGDVNCALKWVSPKNEKELKEKFALGMKVKGLSPEARVLVEQYFLSELVRLHRAGEGEPFDGVKPSGTPIDARVIAADKSIALGKLTPLEKLVEKDKLPELRERFEKVMALKEFNPDDVQAGRKYVEAYVSFFKFAEGEEGHHAH